MTDIRFRILSREVIQERLDDLILISRDIPHENWQDHQYLSYLPGKWRLSLACFSDETLIGYIIASEKEPGRAHIHKFVVNPCFRGKGIGKRMLLEFIKNLNRKINKVTLKVYQDNLQAIKFYQNQVFTITGDFNGIFLMELKLKR